MPSPTLGETRAKPSLLAPQADAKVIIKEAMDALASKDDKVISAYIKRKCDERFGPTVSAGMT